MSAVELLMAGGIIAGAVLVIEVILPWLVDLAEVRGVRAEVLMLLLAAVLCAILAAM